MRTYRTGELADDVGVHPNTVRLYEEWGFLSPARRDPNGYRVFTEQHMQQMRLARLAFRCQFVEGNIRRSAAVVVRLVAGGDLVGAREQAGKHLNLIQREHRQAVEALAILKKWTGDGSGCGAQKKLTRQKAAGELGVSIDVLRGWERNGLIQVPRDRVSGYRLYGPREMERLRVIRTLRAAHYSQMAILRMMRRFDKGQRTGLEQALNTPDPGEDLVYATDRWIRALRETHSDARRMIGQLEQMHKGGPKAGPATK